MDLLKDRTQISEQFRMPVQQNQASVVEDISSETVQLQYFNSGVLTDDAGEAAGTLVVSKLAYSNILDEGGVLIGHRQSTSFAFTTGTILTTIREFDPKKAERASSGSLENIAQEVTEGFANGEFCIDYENGLVYGIKATTGTSDTADYKTRLPLVGVSAPSSSPSGSGLYDDDAALPSGTNKVTLMGGVFDNTDTDTLDEGDTGYVRVNELRMLLTELGMQIAGENTAQDVLKVETAYQTFAVEANATDTHITGPGYVLGMVVVDVGASANVLDIYDNTAGSGTEIIPTADMVNISAGTFIPIMREFSIGLTTVLGTGTAAKFYLIARAY